MVKRGSLALLLVVLLCSSWLTIPNAYANHVVWGDNVNFLSAPPYDLNSGSVDGGSYSVPVIVEVTDTDPNPAQVDTVTVTVTSSVDPTGIVLTLQETTINSGIFQNTNLALMDGNDIFSLSDTAVITIYDPNDPDSLLDDDMVIVASDTDPAGITPIFTEEIPGSNLYVARITFGAASNDAANILAASAGDIISVIDQTGGNLANGIISPNPNSAEFSGAIAVAENEDVFVTYEGDTASFTVTPQPPSGRGGGGLVAPSLVVDAAAAASSNGGDGCKGDCSPPTLGVDDTYRRFVDGGFSYNDHPVDVELFYTHYPLVTVNVGQKNKAVLKIYEDSGADKVEHIELAFGLAKGQILDESKAAIIIDLQQGSKKVSTFDPENVLQDVQIETNTTRCGSFVSAECLVVTIYHTFRAPLDFNIVATDVWDIQKNAWQNYYNDGILVVGDSLNPPKTHMAIHKGHQILITETGKDTAVDDEGNTWTFYKAWVRDYKPQKKIDAITSHGYNRIHDEFPLYKKEQEKLAQYILEEILVGKKIYDEPKSPKTIDFEYITRQENKELQFAKTYEIVRAQDVLNKLLGTYTKHIDEDK